MPKRGYHHGNLRQALIDGALKLIEDRGPTGFTLSEAAKQAGVTPAAVYRHFEGREDLIAEGALQGYEIFAELMEAAYQSGQPSALKAFEATGRAYLAFARDYPGHYIAMEKRPPASMFSAHIWALSHGVVELFARNSPGRASPFPADDLLESGIGIYLRGLGLVGPDD
jgi:AcrR family transcriptional regulator